MLHTTNPVIKHKTGLLNLAEELSNVSKACKIMGVSRDTFYRYRELADEGGVDALSNRSRRAPNLKNRTDEVTEQAVVDYAIDLDPPYPDSFCLYVSVIRRLRYSLGERYPRALCGWFSL